MRREEESGVLVIQDMKLLQFQLKHELRLMVKGQGSTVLVRWLRAKWHS